MKKRRSFAILAGWTALGLVLGGAGAVVLPDQFVSTAELAVDSEALASVGLARFDRLSISDGSEVETLVQLLKSTRLSGVVAGQMGNVSRSKIEDALKVVNEQASPIVKLKVTAGAKAEAQAIGRALVGQAVKIDAERKQQRSREAIEAVRGQVTDVEKQIGGLNGEIQKLTTERQVVQSNDPARQQRAATELAQLSERLAALNVEGSALEQRGRRLGELIASLPTTGAMPSGFAVEEADKSPGLAETRKRLIEQESALASLRSRYGARHARVVATEAEVAASKKSLRDLLATQRTIVQAQTADNASGQKIIEQKMAAIETETKKSDFSFDPAYASLLTRREALVANYGALTTRMTELLVFAAARPSTFYLFSEPTLPDRPSRLRPAATLVAGLLLGAMLGVCHCLLRWRKTPPAESPRPAYAAP